jgi:membrane-bound lytic murein transglycosylase A
LIRRGALVAAAFLLGGCSGVSEPPPVRYLPASFADLPGWPDADPGKALEAFRLGCKAPRLVRASGARPDSGGTASAASQGAAAFSGAAQNLSPQGARSAPLPMNAESLRASLAAACRSAAAIEATDAASARQFFEAHFTPYRVEGPKGPEGLFTGYYEPQLDAARKKRAGFGVPIYALPPEAKPGAVLATRADIENGKAANGWRVLFWAKDPVDVFTLHIQGSGRAVLEEGGFARIAYAGNNGHGYVAIGRLMRERGLLAEGGANMPAIQAWLRANPEAGRALMQENPRFIFFREIPDADGTKGQFGVKLMPLASLAVDPAFIPLGLPLWLDTTWPVEKDKPMRMLVVAQDTGAAIKGPVRGDVFFGGGRPAALHAGHMAQRGRYFLLLPKMQ